MSPLFLCLQCRFSYNGVITIESLRMTRRVTEEVTRAAVPGAAFEGGAKITATGGGWPHH